MGSVATFCAWGMAVLALVTLIDICFTLYRINDNLVDIRITIGSIHRSL